jgi:hypothetical protein
MENQCVYMLISLSTINYSFIAILFARLSYTVNVFMLYVFTKEKSELYFYIFLSVIVVIVDNNKH